MDEDQKEEKPIDTVSIVLLILISLTSDISDLVTDLIAAVPVVGQIVYLGNSFLISPITWIIIQGWFIMKVGLSGRKGLITGVSNLLGGLGNIANLPGSETIMTTIAIVAANHGEVVGALAGATGGPTAALLAKHPKIATAAATVGGGPAAGGVVATTTGRETAMDARVATTGGAETETAAAPRPGLAPSQVSEEAFGVQKEPLEKLKEVMEKIPEPEEKRGEENI